MAPKTGLKKENDTKKVQKKLERLKKYLKKYKEKENRNNISKSNKYIYREDLIILNNFFLNKLVFLIMNL